VLRDEVELQPLSRDRRDAEPVERLVVEVLGSRGAQVRQALG